MSRPAADVPQVEALELDEWADARVLLDQQTEVLELVAGAAPLRDVLTRIITSLEGLMPEARCSVLLLDREHGTLHHGAAPSLPDAYVRAIDGLVVADGAGSCGTAAALNAPVVVSDVCADPRWADFRTAAQQAGLRSCWSTPIEGQDGRPVGTFAVYHRRPHDPSRREERLVDRFTHLASVAIDHDRAGRDREARLEAETARRTAEELSHAKSELLAAIGHEVRTPIQAIVGFAELLATLDLDEPRRREALDHIGAAACHVMELLTDVLDLSRLEVDALPVTLEPVVVREVVDEVLGLLSPKADDRRITLTHELTDETVVADRLRLRQVLLNLVGNGVRHGREHGHVTLRAHADGTDEPDSPDLLLHVEDDGPGIPPDLLPRVFTPFARARCRPTPHGESIGLGLGLAHGLAVAMAGGLTVDRTGDTGTTLVLRLPRPR